MLEAMHKRQESGAHHEVAVEKVFIHANLTRVPREFDAGASYHCDLQLDCCMA